MFPGLTDISGAPSLSGGDGGNAGPARSSASTQASDEKTNGIIVSTNAVNFGELISALLPGPTSNGAGLDGGGSSPTFSETFGNLSTSNLGAKVSSIAETTTKPMLYLYGGVAVVIGIVILKLRKKK